MTYIVRDRVRESEAEEVVAFDEDAPAETPAPLEWNPLRDVDRAGDDGGEERARRRSVRERTRLHRALRRRAGRR